MKIDKRKIHLETTFERKVATKISNFEIVRKVDGERVIRPTSFDGMESKDVNPEDLYIEIRKFLFEYHYNEQPKKDNNLPILKEHFRDTEDFIGADVSGFLRMINKFGLMSDAEEESTEIWSSILKYIAFKGDYAILDHRKKSKIAPFNLMSKNEIQIIESEVIQFKKLNDEIKTRIKKNGFHLYSTTLGSTLILFALKNNFPQALKCQNTYGNCKNYFIDLSKAQRGEYCSPRCARAQNRFVNNTKRQETESGFIEEILIPKIKKSGWSNSDIKREYMISKKLKTRADIVLTFEDKPLVMIEVKLITSKRTLNEKWKEHFDFFQEFKMNEMKMQLIRHAREIKVPYAMVCSDKKNFLIDIEKTKSWQEGTFFLMTYDGISEIDSIITPDQARGLEDA